MPSVRTRVRRLPDRGRYDRSTIDAEVSRFLRRRYGVICLGKLGFEGVKDVRVGKIIEIEIDEVHAKAPELKERLQKMADEMLANPVIEDYEVRV